MITWRQAKRRETIMSQVSTTSRHPMRVGVCIRVAFGSPYGEGLLQYLTLLLNGAERLPITLNLLVASAKAFERWRDGLPDSLRDQVSISLLPDAAGSSEFLAGVQAFESEIDCWLSIRPDDPFIRNFHKPIVAIFADYVYAEYPMFFDPNVVAVAHATITDLQKNISQYICFSSFVKKRHLMAEFKIPEDRITVVPHAKFDYSRIAKVDFTTTSAAADRIRQFLSEPQSCLRDEAQHRHLSQYLRLFPFEEVRYIFVSTRNRPHKNTTITVQALKLLLRSYLDIKLITTAPMEWNNPHSLTFDKAVMTNHLHMDVVSINETPPDVHAALYKCAAVTVHPSPFEGGFPFTAFESISMGTPVLIANGPIAREFLPREAWPLFLFEPTSAAHLASRIKEVIRDRERVLQAQAQVLRAMPGSPAESVKEIIDVMIRACAAAPVGVVQLSEPVMAEFTNTGSGELVAVSGWHKSEDWGSWASDRRAVIRFWRAEGALIDTMDVLLSSPPVPPSQKFTLTVMLNGVPVAENVVWQGVKEMHIGSGIVDGLNEIVIHSHELFRPVDAGGSPDPRVLGIGVSKIRFG